MAVKMNLRMITKNHAADPEKGFVAKIDFKAVQPHVAMPQAWELTNEVHVCSQI